MKHYHGTPLGGTRESVARFVVAANRFFLVPYGRDEDLPIVADQSCGFCVDNGAFTAWKSGNPITNWQGYYNWCRDLQRNPRFDFAIIPDVIDGTEEQNKALFAEWFQRCKTERGIIEGAAVWHMHESMEYLDYLIRLGGRVLCIGSSGDYAMPGTERWHERMAEAMDVLCDQQGRPRVKIHGLRMLNPEIVERYPFYSCDSTNVAQNSQLLGRYGIYKPPSQAQRREVLAARIESVKSPSVWQRTAVQQPLELTG